MQLKSSSNVIDNTPGEQPLRDRQPVIQIFLTPLLSLTVGVTILGAASAASALHFGASRIAITAIQSQLQPSHSPLNSASDFVIRRVLNASPTMLISQLDTGTLQIQDSGDAVTQLQQRLADLGYYNGPISGYFGDLTEDAVIRFQQDNGLTADGVVGPATQDALQLGSSSGGQPSPSPAPTPAPDTDSSESLEIGDSGDRVIALQNRLRALNYYNGPIDGDFGQGTQNAVIQFQLANGLTADGVVGPATQAALNRPATPSPTPTPTPTPIPTPTPLPTPIPTPVPTTPTPIPLPNDGILQRGDTGTDVTALQRRLRELGFYNGPLNGEFGTQTEDAVRAFQQSRGINADGIVGPATANALNLQGSIAPDGGRFSVLDLQRRLRDRGFYSGPFDGVLGTETRQAIRAAQRQYNLTEGDILDGRF